MKFSIESTNLPPIHLLRYLMFVKWTGFLKGVGVLEADWEVRCIFTEIDVLNANGGREQIEVFPEFGGKPPFRVSGLRLVERLALVIDVEETEFVRLTEGGFDLLIFADTSLLVVETDDEELFRTVKLYFDRTSGPEFFPDGWNSTGVVKASQQPEERAQTRGKVFF